VGRGRKSEGAIEMSKLFVTVDHDIYIPKHEALGWKEERDDLPVDGRVR